MDFLLGQLFDDDYDDLFDLFVLDYMMKHERRRTRLRSRPNHFTKWNNIQFRNRFRLSKEAVRLLIEETSETLSSTSNRNSGISSSEMVLLTLRYLATGNFADVTRDFCGINRSTARRIVGKVARVIAGLMTKYVNMPVTELEVNTVREGFYNIARFPRCIGVLDCTHVKIQNPGGARFETFKNSKSFFSLNVQVVIDVDMNVKNIVCRWPGAARDSQVFDNSRLKQQFEEGRFSDSLMVADNAFSVEPYLITPLLNPRTPAEKLFNEVHVKTRAPVGRFFEAWKRRFPALALGLRLDIDTVQAVIVACAVLHNLARRVGDLEPSFVDQALETAIELTNNVNNGANAMEVRDGKGSLREVLITKHFQGLI